MGDKADQSGVAEEQRQKPVCTWAKKGQSTAKVTLKDDTMPSRSGEIVQCSKQ